LPKQIKISLILWGFGKEILTEQFYVCGMCMRYLGHQATE